MVPWFGESCENSDVATIMNSAPAVALAISREAFNSDRKNNEKGIHPFPQRPNPTCPEYVELAGRNTYNLFHALQCLMF